MKLIFSLTFVICFSVSFFPQENQLKTGFYIVVTDDFCPDSADYLQIKDSTEEYCINKNPILTDDAFTSVRINKDTTSEGVFNTIRIKIDSAAAEVFKSVTEKLVGQRMAFIINNKIIAAPILRDPVESGEIAVFCDDEAINRVKEAFHLKTP